jgi:hypothetical protein
MTVAYFHHYENPWHRYKTLLRLQTRVGASPLVGIEPTTADQILI